MTDIKIDFSNTKVAKFYDEMNGHLAEIEKVIEPPAPSEDAAPPAPVTSEDKKEEVVEEFQTTEQ